MTEVRSLFTATAEANDGSRSASGLLTESCSQQTSDQTQQYGLFATTDYKEGDVILTESPIVVLSHLLEASTTGQKPTMASSVGEVIRSQFNEASFESVKASSKKDTEGTREKNKASPIKDIHLPKKITDKLNSSFHSVEAQTKKLRGMILAAATYAAYPPSYDDSKKKLFELYHPSIDSEEKVDKEAQHGLELAKIAVECCKELVAPGSSLANLLNDTDAKESNEQELLKTILIYSCNAFEGGRIYHQLSRANHSCNPNAVVVEGDTPDESVLKAACPIEKGGEITISYLGKELYAGYPARQRKLRMEKHFICKCLRCTGLNGEEVSSKSKSVSLDLASRIPCPICHPRKSRYLDEDLMFDEEEDDLQISYALAENGMTPEERMLHCISCGGVTSVSVDGSVRKKREGMAIKYMCMAEDKVYEIDSNKFSVVEEEDSNNEQDVDRSLLQMATATCGAKHWTTQILSLAIIEETLANLQATLMSIDPGEDEKTMEEVFSDIAECADGIEKAYEYAKSLKLNLDPAHFLFDYVLGLARTLVGLGDAKSQKYGSDWIGRVEDFANKFEGEAMRKVVFAIKNAWTRDNGTGKAVDEADGGDQGEAKRRKVGLQTY